MLDVTLGPLLFAGTFNFDAAASAYSLSGGSARLGLAPTAGEAFKPLLEIDGAVSFQDAAINPNWNFTVSGTIAMATLSPQVPLWQSLSNAVLVGSDLVNASKGVNLSTGAQQVTIDNGSAILTPNNLRFFDPATVANTSDDHVRLQGSVVIGSDPLLSSLTGTVSGSSQFVIIDPAPPPGTSPGVLQMNATLGASFSLAGLQFGAASLTATYANNNLGVIVDGASLSFGLEGATVHVDFNNAGMIVKNGKVSGFELAVTESFDLLGLKFDLGHPDPFTVDYVVGTGGNPSVFAMSGDISLSTTSGEVLDKIDADFGSDLTKGLIISGGTVTTIDVTIKKGSRFDLFGLTIEVNDVHVQYSSSTSILQITTQANDGIVAKSLFRASASLPVVDPNTGKGGVRINTSTGAVSVEDVKIELADVNLGAFTVNDLLQECHHGRCLRGPV